MEKLLTIKEAAVYLNVSQMSLRRWTNAGKLECYRVGGKNERRFSLQHLQNFLQLDENFIPLGINNFKVESSDHITHFYRKVEESLDEGISYLAKGLSLGESLFVISTDTRLPQILAGLESFGYPVKKFLREGVITTNTGHPDLTSQLQFMDKAIKNIPSPKGFRLLGDMMWALDQGWDLNDITALENNTNQALISDNALILCQYDLSHFGADTAMMGLDTHNLIVYRGQLEESPYFVMATI